VPYSREKIGELLLAAHVITPEQLQTALEVQVREGGKLGEVLVRELVVSENQIASALAEQKGLEHVNLATTTVDRSVAVLLPLRTARRRCCIPIGLEGGVLTLAMADPLDVEAIDEAELITGFKVVPVVAAASQVRFAVEKYIAGAGAMLELELVESGRLDHDEDVEAVHDASVAVVRIVNQIIHEAVLAQASDIHFEPSENHVLVRYRVDGVLRHASQLPKSSQAELLSRVKVMADMDITERRRPQDGRFAARVDGKALDLRVATLPTPNGEAITLRILDSEVAFHPLGDTGLTPDGIEAITRMLAKPYGALFISGPTGSGKSTTLYALMHAANDPGRKVITVEDPIEYRMDGVTQMAVNARIGLTFAAGLRTILRSDPDVVMVGEVRDPETAEIAVRAALTGHLVLSSIHTNDAPSALTRLTDMGVPPYITSSGLLGAVAQRLVRTLCPKCREKVDDISTERLRAAGFEESELPTLQTYRAKGCPECSQTGYKGRIGVFEVMEFDDTLQTLFLRNAPTFEMRQAAIDGGMRTLRRDALDKVKNGVTSLEEIDRVVV